MTAAEQDLYRSGADLKRLPPRDKELYPTGSSSGRSHRRVASRSRSPTAAHFDKNSKYDKYEKYDKYK